AAVASTAAPYPAGRPPRDPAAKTGRKSTVAATSPLVTPASTRATATATTIAAAPPSSAMRTLPAPQSADRPLVPCPIEPSLRGGLSGCRPCSRGVTQPLRSARGGPAGAGQR